jgi:hypothetical protein
MTILQKRTNTSRTAKCPENIRTRVVKTWRCNDCCYYDAGVDLGISAPTVKKIINDDMISTRVIRRLQKPEKKR